MESKEIFYIVRSHSSFFPQFPDRSFNH